MPLYFAYGSNMSPRQMQRRCPGAKPVGAAMADGWRFIITTRGGANIVREPGWRVAGVVWRVTGFHLAHLDKWEGVSAGIYRRALMTVTIDGRKRSVIAYISNRRWPGRSRTDYMMTAILPGAASFGLPEDYRGELARWLGRRPIGPIRHVYRGRRSRPKLPRSRLARVRRRA